MAYSDFRTSTQWEPEQLDWLKARAARLDRSVAWVERDLVQQAMDAEARETAAREPQVVDGKAA